MATPTVPGRLSAGLARLSALGRDLIDAEPRLADLLQRIADEAKVLAGAAYSAVVLLREGSEDEVASFVYNAPRDRFPEQLPRLVGLLAVPVRTGEPARIDDIRGHPDGVGIPVRHPPIGPLLAVPILTRGVAIGEIAVGNDPAHRPFDDVDERLLVDLAAHTAIAVRWTQTREQVRAEAQLRSELMAMARHDIRNPLTIAKGYIALLERRRDQLSAAQLETAITALREAFERIDHFAEHLFVSDGAATMTERPAWAVLSVAALADQIAADHNADRSEQPVVCVVDVNCADTFAGDPVKVRQVLDNLISNARKYGDPGTPVTVSVRGESDQVRFDVHNVGAGIPLEEQERLFEPYFRAAAAVADGIPGSGLGLAIVRRLVELHGGVLGVASRPGEGTTFWVTFPCDAPATD